MATTAGALSQVSVGSTTASLSSAVATAGTAPYTYQWYRSIVSGFTPGGGNIISGATSLTLNDTGLTPSTQYYYKVVATDSSATPVTGTSAQLAVSTTQAELQQNQFALSELVGTTDLRFNGDTISVQVDASQATALVAGEAVKVVDSADGVPKVVAISAITDEVFGFVNFDIKSKSFPAGSRCEISQAGNVMYLYATAAIARGARVYSALSTKGGVQPTVSTANYVGYAIDKASTAGQLIRVKLVCPSFTYAS